MRPLAKKHRLEEPAAPLNRVLGLARRAGVVGVSFCDHQIATLDLVLAVHDLPDRSGDIPVAIAEGDVRIGAWPAQAAVCQRRQTPVRK